MRPYAEPARLVIRLRALEALRQEDTSLDRSARWAGHPPVRMRVCQGKLHVAGREPTPILVADEGGRIEEMSGWAGGRADPDQTWRASPHGGLVNRMGGLSEQDHLRLERRVLLGAGATLLVSCFESGEGVTRRPKRDPRALGQLSEAFELVRPDRARRESEAGGSACQLCHGSILRGGGAGAQG